MEPHAGMADGHGAGEPSGLAVAAQGYVLAPEATAFTRDHPGVFALRVLDRPDDAVTHFDTGHERAMHVIVVRRDLTGPCPLPGATACSSSSCTAAR